MPNGLPADSLTARGSRPRVHGKFLYAGDAKLYVRGVTYGTFRGSEESGQFPARDVVERDFAQMAANGVNAVRTYTLPPVWLLDLAGAHGLYVMAGIPWEQHITFLDDPKRVREIRERVREGVCACAGHPAILCYSIGNEIPASIVRWHGRKAVEAFLRSLFDAVKAIDPEGLTTYVNFPTTEFLQLDFVDFVSFNVYLESKDRLEGYLARLHSLAGERPLVMAEVGLDSRRNGEAKQAEVLRWQIESVFAAGCAGVFLFAWTDEWYRGGHDIDDWDFGLVDRDRAPKAALSAVREAFASGVPFPEDRDWPTVTVVICSYNGSRTLRETLEHVTAMPYPNFDVIVVNDGSKDATPAIAAEFPVQMISIPNGGLSNARNVGMRAATGEIIAYCDDDAYPDPHWLHYLAHTYMTTDVAGAGGPNLPPPGDGPIAEAVANAPGGPNHVLLTDTEAEHIPGCNSSYRRSALIAVDGYDPAFQVAGDDVDLCWRIQDNVGKVGFHPAAMVWHHRRNSIVTYYRQQRGYGRAEALLERKWPEKYNVLGHLSWHGRIYSAGVLRALSRRSRIYHGVWGTAAFQSLYDSSPEGFQVLVQMPEWYLICAILAGVSVLGLVWRPLLVAAPVLAIAVSLVVLQIGISVARAVFPSRPASLAARMKLYVLTALLFLLQPAARLQGRIGWGLSPWRVAASAGWRFPLPKMLTVWTETWRSDESWLHELEGLLKGQRCWVRRGSDFDAWDLEVTGGFGGGTRITTAIEEHGGGKQFVRFRLRPTLSTGVLTGTILAAMASLWARMAGDPALAAVFGVGAAGGAGWMGLSCGYAAANAAAAVETLRTQFGVGGS
jgi:GT2 family glycosyltransferase